MPKTVMVVEDYADTREMMKFLIQSQGYTVVEAVDGSDAVEKSAEYHLDLILMDLAMPIMDGSSATKRIREMKGNDQVSIIALTGFSNTSYKKVIEAGFDGVLVKPLQFETLAPLLNHYLA